ITARATSPFFTLDCGMASFTETTMTSPSEAYLRREPPSTLMHWTFLAPELSATSRIVCCWIMTPRPPNPSRASPPPASASPWRAGGSPRCAPGHRASRSGPRRAPCTSRRAGRSCRTGGRRCGAPPAPRPSSASCWTPPRPRGTSPCRAPCPSLLLALAGRLLGPGLPDHAQLGLAGQRQAGGHRAARLAQLRGGIQHSGVKLALHVEDLLLQLRNAGPQLLGAQLPQLVGGRHRRLLQGPAALHHLGGDGQLMGREGEGLGRHLVPHALHLEEHAAGLHHRH